MWTLSPMQGSDVTTSKYSVMRVISVVAGSAAAAGALTIGTAATTAATRAERISVIIARPWTLCLVAPAEPQPLTGVATMMDLQLQALCCRSTPPSTAPARRQRLLSGAGAPPAPDIREDDDDTPRMVARMAAWDRKS